MKASQCPTTIGAEGEAQDENQRAARCRIWEMKVGMLLVEMVLLNIDP